MSIIYNEYHIYYYSHWGRYVTHILDFLKFDTFIVLRPILPEQTQLKIVPADPTKKALGLGPPWWP